ncbi:SigE family RNA polymerase sigma factor [Sporichthya brevicatena]|uniref:SigE family RNA polymerase sigma factor n=1 Tax=Sporichthya brevicatena TaxID=171442 RepID=A0ABP3RWS4_9ACTN
MRIRRGVTRDDEFVAFVRDASPRLCRVAYLVCGNWHLAEDTVQASLVKLYLSWDRVDRDSDPWSYARRTVVNAAIDESRRPWRRETATDVLPDVAVPTPSALDDQVVEALSALPRAQRAVVVLRYIEDLDVDTVAHVLGLPSGTVKSHAARGLTSLRARLTPMAVGASHTEEIR